MLSACSTGPVTPPRPFHCAAAGAAFCRTHGARASTDAAGTLEITERDPGLTRYRFGHQITDFLICRGCGAYVAAVMEIDGALYATLNANMLDARDRLDPAPPLADYEAETAAERRERRRTNWTAAVIVTDAG